MRLSVGLAALAVLAACGGDRATRQADADLERDLRLAGSDGAIELLPAAASTEVVSAVEQTGTAAPAPSPTKARVPDPRPRRVSPKPRTTSAPSPRSARPAPRPTQPVFGPDVISPPPPGGYKTVDEVIRNAPFPIKP